MSANLLHLETSPYLLQHARNPVHWRAWNRDTLEYAQALNRLMVISIGYSACHWCHVMERESFEDEEVAHIMNKYYVSVKVDREERPDVDAVYMDACQLMTGRGGWPLNAIALPDGRPVYAGTYFPKQQWIQVLQYFAQQWEKDPDALKERAAQITRGIQVLDVVAPSGTVSSYTSAEEVFGKIDSIWDYERGGRAGAPKFPMPVLLQYLMLHHYYTSRNRALLAVQVTADNLCAGGIYDHLGGGFYRYSVDDRWEIPHFEKMLYDNAQLMSFFAEAYQYLQKEDYRRVVEETYGFLERELSAPQGGYYAALDADSEGEEGKFYLWSFDELQQILGDDLVRFAEFYPVSSAGNFEHKNHLIRNTKSHRNEIGTEWLEDCKQKLLEHRNRRPRPGLDDKVLTSWNALAISGLVRAYRALGDEKYLNRALRCAEFLQEYVRQPDGSVLRSYKNGTAKISGFLDDYAFLCDAYLDIYETTLQQKWLLLADETARYVIQHFFNVSTGLFFYTSVNDDPLIVRKTETADNVIPSSNAVMFRTLYKLSLILENDRYIEMVQNAVKAMQPMVREYPSFYALWASLTCWLRHEPYLIAIAGEGCTEFVRALQQHYLPDVIWCGSVLPDGTPSLQNKHVPGKTLLYACRLKTCSAPWENPTEVIQYLKREKTITRG
ncbi:MAG: thioredoxin domain-containing protein [Chitinophagales bacterium]|nr:thioredoxin domain-containing protein [Chitinophagales bacterium]MDW8418803.1 thioredoxin domain-containing protein [Chitinophagales bacterium]